MKGIVLLGLIALVSVQALPAKREHNSKLSRQEPVTPIVEKIESRPVVQKVSTIQPEVGSVAPIGDVIENARPSTTTLAPIEVQTESTANPLGDPKSPPPPTVTLPQVNVTGVTYPESFQPPRPPRPPPSTPPPSTTTKKPEEEDSSSEEEESGPPGPGAEGGPDGPGGPPGGPGGPPGGAEEENEDNEDNENETDDAENEDAEDEEEVEEEEEAEDEEDRRRNNLQLIDEKPEYVNGGAQPDPNVLADSNLDAFIPGYVTPEGEVLVPIDTLEHAMPYSIIPDKRTKQGRLDITFPRQDFGGESSEELEDDTSSAEDDDDFTSEEEEDDVLPVRINSFNIIYGNEKKKKQEKEKQDEDATETETEEIEGAEPVIEVAPEPINRPTNNPDGSATIIRNRKPTPEPLPPNPTEEQLKSRPPPLRYVPATRPTNEDDENELRRLTFRSLFHPSVHPYRYFYPEPSYEYRPYDDVSQEYYGYY